MATATRHRNRGGEEPNTPSPVWAPEAISRLLAQALTLAVLTLTPWLFGGVEPAAQFWLFVVVLAALAACWFSELSAQSKPVALPAAIVPLFLGLSLGVAQLVPLPPSMHQLLSPTSHRLWTELAGTVTPSGAPPEGTAATERKETLKPVAEWQPVSLYPGSTRQNLSLLVLAASLFFLGTRLFDTARAKIVLAGVIALNGTGLAFFGIVQQLTWNGRIFWRFPMTSGGVAFASYVNRNNAAGFLNLCLAGALGLLIWSLNRHRGEAGTKTLGNLRNHPASVWRGLVGYVAGLDALTLASAIMAVCMMAGIFCSLSRGGAVAMLAGTAITLVSLAVVRGGGMSRLVSLGGTVLVGLALVGWLGMYGAVQSRLGTLMSQQAVSQESRLSHWQDALRGVPDFWFVGSGMGTYHYVYPLYEQNSLRFWFYHAENQYLEALLETGVCGLGLLLALVGMVAWASHRLLRSSSDPRLSAFAVVGVFALSTQVIQGAFDFGLYMPANMMLFALLCGAITVPQIQKKSSASGNNSLLTRLSPRGMSLTCGAILFGAMVWETSEAWAFTNTDYALRQTEFLEAPAPAPAVQVDRAEQILARALERRPDDAETQLRMAQLWLFRYRAGRWEELKTQQAAGGNPEQLWQLTSPEMLHAQVHYWTRIGDQGTLSKVLGAPFVTKNLPRAWEHLLAARRACPLLAQVHLDLAELSLATDHGADEQTHLRQVSRLAPARPEILFLCGVLELQAGKDDLACEAWKKCLATSDDYLANVLPYARNLPNLPAMVGKLFPDSPGLMITLAKNEFSSAQDSKVRLALADRAQELVEQLKIPDAERLHYQAEIQAVRGANAEAITSLISAVELKPQEHPWRYELAKLLKQAGRLEEAHEHARYCLRQVPDDAAYELLLREILQAKLRKIND